MMRAAIISVFIAVAARLRFTGLKMCRKRPFAARISQAISTSACDAAFRAMEIARAAGVRISYDTNLRLRLWPASRAAAVIHAAIAMADIALPSLEDATALTGLKNPYAICDFYLRLTPLVVLKCGAEGAILATREARHRLPAHKVAAVDATGAGDCFAGNFLARLLAGDAPLDAARYANAAAALSTTGYGGLWRGGAPALAGCGARLARTPLISPRRDYRLGVAAALAADW